MILQNNFKMWSNRQNKGLKQHQKYIKQEVKKIESETGKSKNFFEIVEKSNIYSTTRQSNLIEQCYDQNKKSLNKKEIVGESQVEEVLQCLSSDVQDSNYQLFLQLIPSIKINMHRVSKVGEQKKELGLNKPISIPMTSSFTLVDVNMQPQPTQNSQLLEKSNNDEKSYSHFQGVSVSMGNMTAFPFDSRYKPKQILPPQFVLTDEKDPSNNHLHAVNSPIYSSRVEKIVPQLPPLLKITPLKNNHQGQNPFKDIPNAYYKPVQQVYNINTFNKRNNINDGDRPTQKQIKNDPKKQTIYRQTQDKQIGAKQRIINTKTEVRDFRKRINQKVQMHQHIPDNFNQINSFHDKKLQHSANKNSLGLRNRIQSRSSSKYNLVGQRQSHKLQNKQVKSPRMTETGAKEKAFVQYGSLDKVSKAKAAKNDKLHQSNPKKLMIEDKDTDILRYYFPTQKDRKEQVLDKIKNVMSQLKLVSESRLQELHRSGSLRMCSDRIEYKMWKNKTLQWFYSKQFYYGQLKAGQRHGWGISITPSKQKYEGEYKHNERSGWGATFYNKNSSYRGYWLHDCFEGKGVHVTDHSVYSGLHHFGQKHGFGIQSHANGDYYDGYYSNGLYNGKGYYQWKGGAFYFGNFKAGKKHGFGKWVSASGDSSYEGGYRKNQRHGYGEFIQKDAVKTGHFAKDRLCDSPRPKIDKQSSELNMRNSSSSDSDRQKRVFKLGKIQRGLDQD